MPILPEVQALADEVRSMKIRGAGEIARSAAKGLLLTAEKSKAQDADIFVQEMEEVAKLLLDTRPTAVSLPNAVRSIMHQVHVTKLRTPNLQELKQDAIKTASAFIENSRTALQRIGEIGARRIRDGDVLLTHCNSTAAIAVIKTAWAQGKKIHVFVTETRPRFQGWITTKELTEAGIPVTLILDDAVRFFVGEVDKVIVGADAITANGAIVNKIGTSMIALAAREARVRVFVAAETYKFSPETMIGELVSIEERPASEIISEADAQKLPNVQVRNPAFDITPPEYVDLIITERGIIPPQGAIMIIQETMGMLTPEELLGYQTYQLREQD